MFGEGERVGDGQTNCAIKNKEPPITTAHIANITKEQ
jgi:hypothetical protein